MAEKESFESVEKTIVINTSACIIVCMDFEWDGDKNKVNITKHGLSFRNAKSAFSDKYRIIMLNEDHSKSEKSTFVLVKRLTVELRLLGSR